ncbi:glycosyltransferase [Alteromonas sp. CI.11.F.A3]|uniref:glycosyltransferase n=1 Tax=Alteromonas sp. CI.11.F.A3 TaxID=3079555 RepID=UPI0029427388|nr:glycosyltransferase [Alteromonas sp. CI.11.F.A3]WOI38202.1 glycosyltransferase [Alteromonas sp. CI.11.F.A3]
MRIALIAHPRFPIKSPFPGGLEAFVSSLIDFYAEHVDVTVYAHPESDIPKHVNFVTFPLDSKAHETYPELIENDFLLKVMEDILVKQFDAVHNNAISPIPAVWACKYDIPLLTTLHTPPYSRLKASAELTSLSPNVHYNAVSFSVAEQWQPYISDTIDVIYNGIDLSSWYDTKTSTDSLKASLFSFGRIVPSKGFDLAAKAAALVGIPLNIAGPIYDKHHFENDIAPYLGKGVNYLGHLSHQELQVQLKSAQSAIFAVRWDEPFGLSTVEAMASGTPVAAFNRGAFPEVVSQKGGALALGNNVDSLADAIIASLDVHKDDVLSRAQKFPLTTMCNRYITKLMEIA